MIAPLAAASAHVQEATVDGYRFRLAVTPEQPEAGARTILDVTVTENGAPVRGLFMHLEADDGATHTHTSTEVTPGTYRFDLTSGFAKGGDLRVMVGFTRGGVDHDAYFTVKVGGDTADGASQFLALVLVFLHGAGALALIGGTALVVVLLSRQPREADLAGLIARRYTAVAWISIGLLYASGIGRVLRLGLAPGDFLQTTYGVVLSVKIALALLVALYLGYVSWRLVPRLEAAREGSPAAPREFRRVLIGQMVLFLILLGTVQVLFMSHNGGIV